MDILDSSLSSTYKWSLEYFPFSIFPQDHETLNWPWRPISINYQFSFGETAHFSERKTNKRGVLLNLRLFSFDWFELRTMLRFTNYKLNWEQFHLVNTSANYWMSFKFWFHLQFDKCIFVFVFTIFVVSFVYFLFCSCNFVFCIVAIIQCLLVSWNGVGQIISADL